jgi:hypothetical protein
MPTDKPQDENAADLVRAEMEQVVEKLRDQLAEIHQAEPPQDVPLIEKP